MTLLLWVYPAVAAPGLEPAASARNFAAQAPGEDADGSPNPHADTNAHDLQVLLAVAAALVLIVVSSMQHSQFRKRYLYNMQQNYRVMRSAGNGATRRPRLPNSRAGIPSPGTDPPARIPD